MSVVKVNCKKKNRLITYELCGSVCDYIFQKDTNLVKQEIYEMVIFTRWTNTTNEAKEVDRKVFYFKGKRRDAVEMIEALGVEKVYQYSQYTRFEKEN